MRLYKNAALIVMATLTASVLLAAGCVKPVAPEALAKRACIEMLQKVPVYYESFIFWDVKTLRNDSDLVELYEVWQERNSKLLEERFGIESSSIDYMADAGLLRIVKGDFQLEAVRDSASADFHRDESYQDMEVWRSEPGSDPRSVTGGVVLTAGLFVRGSNNSNVDDFVRLVKAEELSMYDRNADEVLQRLPDGIVVFFSRDAWPAGLIVAGRSYSKESRGTYRRSEVYKFQSTGDIEKSKEDYFKKLEDDFNKAQDEFARRGDPAPYRSFVIKQDGLFMEWSVLVEEKYLIYSLFYD